MAYFNDMAVLQVTVKTGVNGVLQRYGRAAGDSKDRRECKQKKKLYVDNNECVFIGYHYGCIMLFVPKLL